MSARIDPKTLEDKAVPETTKRTYQSGVRHYRRWGGVLPASIVSLRQYLADHSQTLVSSTLENRLAAISRFHREGGWPDPTKDAAVQRVMAGIRNEQLHTPKQAEPLLWHELQRVIRHIESKIEVYPASTRAETDTIRAIRDRALLLTGWHGALRSSDITRLNGNQVVVREHGTDLTLFGKGDKLKKGESLFLKSQPELCSTKALVDWGRVAPLRPGVSVFRGIHPASGQIMDRPLDPKTVTRIIQNRAAEAGLMAKYSSHSLRRGWGVSMAAVFSLGEFMRHGRWKSAEVASRYQQNSAAYRDQQGLPMAPATLTLKPTR
jgi:integrase